MTKTQNVNDSIKTVASKKLSNIIKIKHHPSSNIQPPSSLQSNHGTRTPLTPVITSNGSMVPCDAVNNCNHTNRVSIGSPIVEEEEEEEKFMKRTITTTQPISLLPSLSSCVTTSNGENCVTTNTITYLNIHVMFHGNTRKLPITMAGSGAIVTIHSQTCSTTNASSTSENITPPSLPVISLDGTITGTDHNSETSTTMTYHLRQFLGQNFGDDGYHIISNHQAEYSALIMALQMIQYHISKNIGTSDNHHRVQLQQLHIQVHSRTIMNHLNNNFYCKQPILHTYYTKTIEYIQSLVQEYTNYFCTISSTTTTTTTNHHHNNNDTKPSRRELYNLFDPNIHNPILRLRYVIRDQNKYSSVLANEAMKETQSYMTTSDDQHGTRHVLPIQPLTNLNPRL